MIISLVKDGIDLLSKAKDLFTGDDKEKAELLIRQLEIEARDREGQREINKVEAAHRSIFVAGWRPAIGWICALSLANNFIAAPYVKAFWNVDLPTMNDEILWLVGSILGIGGGLRTYEKKQGLTK